MGRDRSAGGRTVTVDLSDLAMAVLVASVAAFPLALSGWALLDAARRPEWAWALAGRRQVVWMAAIMFGTLTVIGGVLMSVLFDRKFYGQGVARLLAIAPFFVMPTVSALIWKNMILHPVYGLVANAMRALGMTPIDWFADYPLTAVIIIVAWQWLPFAFLILFTAIQSLDQEQKEAARIDGAGPIAMFFYITLPHLKRAIAVVVMMETIFLLSIFAEIYTTTGGGPGNATTNLSYLIYALGLQQFDVGLASAGGIIAVVVANVVSFFLVRMLARNLKGEYDK